MKFQKIMVVVIFFILSSMPLLELTEDNETVPLAQGSNIRIMGYNLHFGQSSEGKYDLDALKELILLEKPNVVGFEEITFASAYNGYTAMYNELRDMMFNMGYEYSYTPGGYDYILSNAIFSQYEIVESRGVEFSDQQNIYQRNLAVTTLDVNGREVHFMVTHLTHVPGGGDSGDLRISQTTEMMNIINAYNLTKDNIVLTGDFNIKPLDEDGELTPEYEIIIADLYDAYNASNPNDDGFTSSASDPHKRIDFIFLSPAITTNACYVVQTLVSDHLPLLCDIIVS